jgi:predicted RNA-binding Zn-ribbon protein involved in translation (DUF1610 family)
MTAPDDLKPGIFVALVGYKREHTVQRGFLLLDVGPDQVHYDGRPLEILETSLPFLAVTDGRKTFAVDLREWDVKRVSKRYAQAMWPEKEGQRQGRGPGRRRQRISRQEPVETHTCPRCGTRMVERLSLSTIPDQHGWFLVCPQCDYNAGPTTASRP